MATQITGVNRTERIGPLLTDGTALASLLDDDNRKVQARALTDPEIYRIELEALFARAWIAVAHESEIPNAGDYVSRYIGEDPVIVTRARDGSVHIMLNACRHRGMQVCRAELGNAKSFRCPYHGWTYDNTGALKGVPAQKEMYGDDFDKSQWSLRNARVGSYGGMIFGNWDDTAAPLEEYLGDIAWYLNAMFARTDSGMEVLGPPMRWVIDTNWKLPAEQFSGDAYHTSTLHRSLIELGVFGSPAAGQSLPEHVGLLGGIDVSTRQGHGLRCVDLAALWQQLGTDASRPPIERLKMVPPPGMSPDLVEQLPRHLDEAQVRMLADYAPVVGNVFPTLAFLNFTGVLPDHEPAGVLTWRIWIPKGPGRTEIMSWVVVEKDAPDAIKENARLMTIRTFSDSGIFEQDDAEAWAGIQRGVAGVIGQRQGLYYGAQLDVGGPTWWPGDGLVFDGPSRDDNQWLFWRSWRDYVTGAR